MNLSKYKYQFTNYTLVECPKLLLGEILQRIYAINCVQLSMLLPTVQEPLCMYEMLHIYDEKD